MSKILNIFIACLIVAGFSACDKEDYTGDSTLVPNNSAASLSFDLPATLTEKDTSFFFTVTIDPPQVVNTTVPVRLVAEETTAVEGADFDFDHLLTIPAYASSATGEFALHSDCEVEEGERVTLQIGNSQTSNVSLSQSTHSIDLANLVGEGLDVYATWEGTVTVGGTEYALCDNVDIDMYLLDSEGNNLFAYDGATASCNEHIFISGLDNGTYDLMANLWAHAVPYDSVAMEVATYPISVEFDKCGLFTTPGAQSAENAVKNSDADYYMGGSVFKPIAKITVSGDEYTWEMQ